MMSKKNKELLSELMAAVYAKEILEREGKDQDADRRKFRICVLLIAKRRNVRNPSLLVTEYKKDVI